MSSTTVPDLPEVTDSDLSISRVFDAPREVVWGFFTRPGCWRCGSGRTRSTSIRPAS